MVWLAEHPLLAALAAGVLAALGGMLGWWFNDRLGARSLERARRRADEFLRQARREARKQRREVLLQARQEVQRERERREQDWRQRRAQLLGRERELERKRRQLEEAQAGLEQREEALETHRQALAAREAELEALRAKAAELVELQNERLERISGMSREEARQQLLENLRAEARYEAAALIKQIKDEAQRTAEMEAIKIISLAVERAASEFSAERTVTQFPLPAGDNLKGRIIGQEGRNIRAFEKATGVQLLVEEGSDVVTLSAFNPVHRELGRRVLEELLQDGAIHPRRIEEAARKVRRRLEEEMRRAGRETVKELGLRGVHPEIVQLLGRLKYRSSYGQNVLLHSKEVAYLTGMMAVELGLDEHLARRAGLLHDIGKAVDYEREGTHPEIGAELARRYGEPEEVINAIASHHEDCEVTTPYSVLVAAADALSGARPGARRRSVAEYIRRIEKLEELANSMEGVEQSYALHAGREIRVIACATKLDDARAALLASDLASRIQSEVDYPGKIKVTVIREVRASAFAHGTSPHESA